jgi:hypothetical protein
MERRTKVAAHAAGSSAHEPGEREHSTRIAAEILDGRRLSAG